jgi:hypothetical protein
LFLTQELQAVGDEILLVQDPISSIRLRIDADGFVSKLTTLEANPLVRDTRLSVLYSDWTLESNGVTFPRTVSIVAPGGALLWKEVRSSVELDPVLPLSNFDFLPGTEPDSYDDAACTFGLQTHHNQAAFFQIGFHYDFQAHYVLSEVASGLYLLSSGVNSVVIANDNKVIVVEAAGSEVQARKLLVEVAGILLSRGK